MAKAEQAIPKALRHALTWRGIPLWAVVEKFASDHVHTFIKGEPDHADTLTLLGFDGPDVVALHAKSTWAQIAHHAGLFPSVSEARRAGWDVPIEPGYSEACFRAKWGHFIFVFVHSALSP